MRKRCTFTPSLLDCAASIAELTDVNASARWSAGLVCAWAGTRRERSGTGSSCGKCSTSPEISRRKDNLRPKKHFNALFERSLVRRSASDVHDHMWSVQIADRRVFWTHCKQNNNPERLTIKAHNWHQTEPGPRYTVLSSTRTFTLHYFRKALFFSLWNSGNNEDLNSCVSRWAEYVMCVSVLFSSLLQETFSRRF